MAEETKQKKVEEMKKEETKVEAKVTETKKEDTPKPKAEDKKEVKAEAKTDKPAEKKEETKKTAAKKSDKKAETVKAKDKAVANAGSLHISPKQSKYVCKMIARKDLDTAITLLEGVIAGKVPVKMTGLEVAHQKGKGVAGAQFPKTAAREIMNVVKQLKANAVVNGIENPVISIAMSNQASAPFRRGGRKAKRTSLRLEAQDKAKFMVKKK